MISAIKDLIKFELLYIKYRIYHLILPPGHSKVALLEGELIMAAIDEGLRKRSGK